MNCPTHPNVKLICPACNGAQTSEAKKKASRENGKKGGWPKGKPRKEHAGMTIKQALRKLPTFAAGLYDPFQHKTVSDLRFSVQTELDTWEEGDNPLTDSQVTKLRKFLNDTKL